MKKLFTILLLVVTVGATAQTNVPNGSFENWTNNLPDGWEKLSGRVRSYTTKSYSLTNSQGTQTGTLSASNGTKFLGLLNDSPAVDGQITIGRIKPSNFYLGRKPGELNFSFVYLAGVPQETFVILLYGWYESFGVNDTTFRKTIYFNQTGVLSGPLSGSNWTWLNATVQLQEADYIGGIAPDSVTMVILPTGVFASGQPRTTTLNTELLIDNIRFNNFTTSSKTTLKAGNHTAAYNYPNPATTSTTFVYNLAVKSDVTINIFDINGKLVHTESVKEQVSGEHQLFYNTSNLNNGIYFYNIESDYLTESGKLIIAN